MDNNYKTFLHKISQEHARELVGKICKQNELISQDKSLSKEQALNLLKKFNKNLIYESFRDFRNDLIFCDEGRKYTKLKPYTPTDR